MAVVPKLESKLSLKSAVSDAQLPKQQLNRQEMVRQELQRLKGGDGSCASDRKEAAADDPEALELHAYEEFDEPAPDVGGPQQLLQRPVEKPPVARPPVVAPAPVATRKVSE